MKEFIIGDNTFFATMDERKVTFLNHSAIYFHSTSDPSFNDAMFRNLENLIKNSTQISLVGEKERKKFFNKLRKKVVKRINAIAVDEGLNVSFTCFSFTKRKEYITFNAQVRQL